MLKTDFYVAKNQNGQICLFGSKPHKYIELHHWRSTNDNRPWWDTGELMVLSEDELPEDVTLSWEDDEPVLVKLNLLKH